MNYEYRRIITLQNHQNQGELIMTQEEKELLSKDLYSRLPYKPKVHIEHDVFYDEREPYDTELDLSVLYNRCGGMEIKPYLRPMSSMTDEEIDEWLDICIPVQDVQDGVVDGVVSAFIEEEKLDKAFDWLNAHHFDYRGLIEKGLALEAKEGMYKN